MTNKEIDKKAEQMALKAFKDLKPAGTPKAEDSKKKKKLEENSD